MSSRALRRAQKELELKEQQNVIEREDDSDDDTELLSVTTKGGFGALAINDDTDDTESDGSEEQPDSHKKETDGPGRASDTPPANSAGGIGKKKKKAKRKSKKSAGQKAAGNLSASSATGLDEIDQALQDLSDRTDAATSMVTTAKEPAAQHYGYLIVDAQHLHVANEMRRLFGSAALRDEDEGAEEDAPQGGTRAMRRLQAHGRRGGRSAQLGLLNAAKRNIFVQSKPTWPAATTGGLGMEVERKEDGVTYFKFVHSRAYQDVQQQFYSCVESNDPQRLIGLLQFNPYHISTLLQVADIMEQQSDHAAVGDLIERALFCFGRAAHSSFARLLSEGSARLDFRHPENREFWLAGWRYITNLSMRATWRTVFEWGKLLWALSPVEDPYAMRLVLDQYAIRARQSDWLCQVAPEGRLSAEINVEISSPPNLAYSVALARSQKHDATEAMQARSVLKEAMQKYPWIAARLFKKLGLEPVPPSVWGREPATELDRLYTELYATRAKDIWNTPEATSLLMEVAQTTPRAQEGEGIVYASQEIDLDIGRHVLMTHKRELIALLPGSITRQLDSASDPLPPPDTFDPYGTIDRQERRQTENDEDQPEDV